VKQEHGANTIYSAAHMKFADAFFAVLAPWLRC